MNDKIHHKKKKKKKEKKIDINKTKQNKKTPQIMRLTATPGGVAYTLASATRKRGLNREVQAAVFRVRTRPECPEGNLRELT